MYIKHEGKSGFAELLNNYATKGFHIHPNVDAKNFGFYCVVEEEKPYMPLPPARLKYVIWYSRLHEVPAGYTEESVK